MSTVIECRYFIGSRHSHQQKNLYTVGVIEILLGADHLIPGGLWFFLEITLYLTPDTNVQFFRPDQLFLLSCKKQKQFIFFHSFSFDLHYHFILHLH